MIMFILILLNGNVKGAELRFPPKIFLGRTGDRGEAQKILHFHFWKNVLWIQIIMQVNI